MKENIKEIISNLSLKEKCELCAQNEGSFARVRRLDLVGIVPQDNPRGAADYFRTGFPKEGDGEYHPVAFPSMAALGCSWDQDLAYETGKQLASECLANPTLVPWLFRPGVNIKRSPLCGRNFEYVSEDPVLSGEMAGSYINGVQSMGVAATLKHYICNEQEFERMTTNSVVSERTLREVYALAFEIALKKGKPMSVMTSYNKVNGEWVNSSPHIMDILRKDFGFDGVVVSDFSAIHHTKVAAHKCGMDIELAPVSCHSDELLQAVEKGEIAESVLDEELSRVFELADKLSTLKPIQVDMEEYHLEAGKAAEKCTVLLQNDGILPLSETSADILVLGKLSEDPNYMGGGSGSMNGYKVDKPLDKISEIVLEASYEPGYELNPGFPPGDKLNDTLIEKAVEAAKRAKTIIIFAGPGYCTECEGFDRDSMDLPFSQQKLLDAVLNVNQNVVLVLSCASVLNISKYTKKLRAVLYAPLTGEGFGAAVANILFGKAEPGGRLTETWPVYPQHSPAWIDFARKGEERENINYSEGVYVGYRWYEERNLPVLYPFGHGLSYTSFELGKLKADKSVLTPSDTLHLSLNVKNTGNRAGSEVIEIYLSQKKSIIRRPKKELRGFSKVYLEPGEEKEVNFTLSRDAFRVFSEKQNKWIVQSGIYDIIVATDAQTTISSLQIMMSKGDVPFVYDRMTPLIWFELNDKFYKILEANFPRDVNLKFYQESFDWNTLCLPIPFYRLAEPLLGDPFFSMKEVDFIIERMNEN